MSELKTFNVIGKSTELQNEIVPVKRKGSVATRKPAKPKVSKGATIDTPKGDFMRIKLNKDVDLLTIKTDDDIAATYEVDHVLELDRRRPEVIVGFDPPLLKEYVVDFKLTSFANIGDTITLNRKQLLPKGDIPRKVVGKYFKSLFNMSVIMLILEDGDTVMAHLAIINNT